MRDISQYRTTSEGGVAAYSASSFERKGSKQNERVGEGSMELQNARKIGSIRRSTVPVHPRSVQDVASFLHLVSLLWFAVFFTTSQMLYNMYQEIYFSFGVSV